VDRALRARAAGAGRGFNDEAVAALRVALNLPPPEPRLTPVEAAVMALLAAPISEVDFLAWSNFRRPPRGDGWRPYSYLADRVPASHDRRHNACGRAVRRLERLGLVEVRYRRERARWVRQRGPA
jgi:hypothetical protein